MGTQIVEEQIKKARDILAKKIPISKYIEDNRLGRTTGATGKICCPVHDENTPSFMYNDTKQRCNCFGCGVGGTVVELHFHINKELDTRYTMVRSIKELADTYNVEIPSLYERTITEKPKRVQPSKRKRGTGKRDMDWVYREKLLLMEGKYNDLSVDARFKISGLLDDVWLGKRKAKDVHEEVMILAREDGVSTHGG